MSFQKISEEGLNHNFKVTIEASIINERLNNDLSEIAKTAKIPGFRPGKAPKLLIKRKYGAKVKEDLMNQLISKEVDEIVKNNDYKLVGNPVMEDIKDKENEDFSFTLKLEVRPNLSVNRVDWEKIEIKDYKVVLSQEEIDKQIETLYENYKIFDQEHEVAEKDFELVIDLHGTIDKKEFENNKAKDFKIQLGKNMLGDDFDKKLYGAKKGQELDITITLGKDWKENAGKSVLFKILVKNIYKPRKASEAELLEQLKMKTIDEVVEQFKKIVEEETQSKFFIIKKIQLFDNLEKILQFDVPKTILEREYSEILKYNEKKDPLKVENDANIESNQMSTSEENTMIKELAENISDLDKDQDIEDKDQDIEDKIEKKTNSSISKNKSNKDKFQNISEEDKKIALRRVRIGLLLQEYAQVYQISVDAEQINKFLFKEAKKYGMFEKQMLDVFRKNPNIANVWKNRILEENVVKHIFKNKIKNIEETCSMEEYKKIVKESLYQ